MKESVTHRPWGWYKVLSSEPDTYQVKILCVEKGKRISLQKHFKRSETWTTIRGNPLITLQDPMRVCAPKVFTLKPNETKHIPAEWVHRIEAPSSDILILEFQFGKCDEEDIFRFEDDYNRVEK